MERCHLLDEWSVFPTHAWLVCIDSFSLHVLTSSFLMLPCSLMNGGSNQHQLLLTGLQLMVKMLVLGSIASSSFLPFMTRNYYKCLWSVLTGRISLFSPSTTGTSHVLAQRLLEALKSGLVQLCKYTVSRLMEAMEEDHLITNRRYRTFFTPKLPRPLLSTPSHSSFCTASYPRV